MTPLRKGPRVAKRLRRLGSTPAEPADAGRLPSPDAFPHLRAFLAGYLHQDFLLDHATAADALRAFLGEASAAERAGLAADWRAFRRAIERAGWNDVRGLVGALGGAWLPPNRRALLSLFSELD